MLRNWLRNWLFPEYVDIVKFRKRINNAFRKELNKKEINTEHLIILGNLSKSKIILKPTIKPKLFLDSLLKMAGTNQVLSNNCFSGGKLSFEEGEYAVNGGILGPHTIVEGKK